MSTIPQTAKPGNLWFTSDLKAFNITVETQSARAFFSQDLPDTCQNVDPEFLNINITAGREDVNNNTYALLKYLELASHLNLGQKSAIHGFTQALLCMLGFEERSFIQRSHFDIPLHICGDLGQRAPTNICLLHRSSTYLLIVRGVSIEYNGEDLEASIIAAAIAAFQMNNFSRSQLGIERKDEMSIPCIVMVGTRPMFYVIPVTQQLSQAVETGEYPRDRTVVSKCVVIGQRRSMAEGMENIDLRVEAVKHFLFFRSLAKELWSEFLV